MMFSDLVDQEGVDAFEKALVWAARDKLAYVTADMFIATVLEAPSVRKVCSELGGDAQAIADNLKASVEATAEYNRLSSGTPKMTSKAAEAFARMAMRFEGMGKKRRLTALQMLIDLLESGDGVARAQFESQGIGMVDIKRAAGLQTEAIELEDDGQDEDAEPDQQDEDKTCGGLLAELKDGFEERGFDALVGREAEVLRVEQILSRRRKNNVLLVGDPGVGKTAVAVGFAQRVAEGKVPASLARTTVWQLDVSALMAGTSYKGMFESRVKRIQKTLGAEPCAVLLVDDIAQLLVRSREGEGSDAFRPLLASGKIRFIGTACHEDCRRIDAQRPVARLFEKVDVAEPGRQEALAILQGVAPGYAAHHGVRYAPEALEAAVDLTARHLRDRRLPDKAIDMIDEAGASARLAGGPEGQTIGRAEIEAVVGRVARIAPTEVGKQDKERMRGLPADLKAKIFGQDAAIDQIVSAIRLSRSGLGDPKRPVGCFLFTGPTGTGKTELAVQLAAALGNELIRFDMSEYMEGHSVSRLIGSPPGYVGYDQGGQLTDRVRRTPQAVLLLDEIEKAHPDILNVLLQVMDHGTLTDNQGQSADFRGVVLIMTSNAGATELSRQRIGFSSKEEMGDADAVVRRMFRPEFRNRLDAIVRFEALEGEVVGRIADKFLAELAAQLSARNIQATWAPSLRAHLVDKGYSPQMGARPMRRLVDAEIRRPLSEEILFGALERGGAVTVGWDGKRITLSFGSGSEPAAGAPEGGQGHAG